VSDRRAASDESNQRSDDQLELQDELDTLAAIEEGFDGWDIFDEACRKLAEEAEAA
jgi:hypothetical protein